MSQSVLQDWRSIQDDREKYQAYLCSRDWAILREAVHERASEICERCSTWPIDAVHHLTYARKYHENLDDLQGTCKWCHEFTHGKGKWDFAGEHSALGRYFSFCIEFQRAAWAFDCEGQPDNDAEQAIVRSWIRSLISTGTVFNDIKLSRGIHDAIHKLDSSLPYFYIPHAQSFGVRTNVSDYYELATLLGVKVRNGRRTDE